MIRTFLFLGVSLLALLAPMRSGWAAWTVDGVAVSTAANNQGYPTIVSDGAGGAIIAWHDLRSGNADIYAQRIDASGMAQWTANGVALCTAIINQFYPTIVSDGAGGAIVAWHDSRSGNPDIYARRIDAAGNALWTANGVALCTAVNEQTFPTIVSDGAGGAIVTWQDYRSGTSYDIYARRIDASGNALSTADGVALCTAANDQPYPTIVSDGAGGAIVTWYDLRGGNWDIYARRIDAAGNALWTANGVALCTAVNEQSIPRIASDGAGGAIVAWHDLRSGNADIYAQRIDASGMAQWTADGVALCTAASEQYIPTIVSDGAGGAIVTWQDGRSSGSNWDIYARRIDAAGNALWTPDGVALCATARDQYFPTIVSDGAGGAMVTWQDYRSGTNWDIYAQRVEGHGYVGRPEPVLTSVSDVPGDQGGKVKVNWRASERDVLDLRTITHYSVWRATDAIAVAGTGARDVMVASPSEVPRHFAGAAVWVERRPEADFYWEWVGNQDSHYLAAYTYSAPTRGDSTAQGIAAHQFFVSAHTYDSYVFFDSNVLSGHSVDNLAPAAPLMLTAQRVGSDVQLKWNRVRVADLRDYSIYRATSSGVTPVPINFLASSEDTVAVDAGAPGTALYYIVTASDVHANQSAPSNEASVGATTNVGNTPPITALTVLENVPNPFTSVTRLRIGVPQAGDVEIEVFDVVGRKVRAEAMRLAAGWREVVFEARDGKGSLLPSGVYFYRVKAGGETLTRKMVVTR